MVIFILLLTKRGQGISGNDKKTIKQSSVSDEEDTKLSRDGKDDMTMFRSKSHSTDISSPFLTGFGTTFGTISGIAGMSNNGFFATIRADKEIVTKMDRGTEDGLLKIIKSNIS